MITNRTEEDVNRYLYLNSKVYSEMTQDEKDEWDTQLKGCYNHSDMNRVALKAEDVAAKYNILGYKVDINMKTNWQQGDFLTEVEGDKYILDLTTVKNKIPNNIDIPSTLNNLDYIGANNIEKMLINTDELLDNIVLASPQCGTIQSNGGIPFEG